MPRLSFCSQPLWGASETSFYLSPFTLTATTANTVTEPWFCGLYDVRVRQQWTAWQGEILVRKQTREQRIREQRERDLVNARVLGASLAREEAIQKAEALLREYLTPAQREQLDRVNYFDVIARSGLCYRIRRGTHGNVGVLAGAREIERLCINPAAEANVPVPDAMLAQKLMLEANEQEFRRVANITRFAA